ncbi:MAG: hypothetical protein R2813_07540 [Flavobacteriales bacterium]
MLLNIDPGKACNRTITFAGGSTVVEAAFLLVKKASELIDMSKHKGNVSSLWRHGCLCLF